ncbi:hypothetical protein WN48_07924 [Eufriesea mexicana]|uniref:Uncharacterized protein n=1 Tax=Eufriesea mexicana TaxID=516756 RepID=A0A310S882_9HYME|nr:hypothetical protein WN48_07924 [Eufriesea mexicana]
MTLNVLISREDVNTQRLLFSNTQYIGSSAIRQSPSGARKSQNKHHAIQCDPDAATPIGRKVDLLYMGTNLDPSSHRRLHISLPMETRLTKRDFFRGDTLNSPIFRRHWHVAALFFRLQEIDLLSRLRIRDDLLGIELCRGSTSLSVHYQLSRCSALSWDNCQSLQHGPADALSLEVLLCEVRLRLHQHASVLLGRSNVQHRGYCLRVGLSFLVRFLFTHRRFDNYDREVRLAQHCSLKTVRVAEPEALCRDNSPFALCHKLRDRDSGENVSYASNFPLLLLKQGRALTFPGFVRRCGRVRVHVDRGCGLAGGQSRGGHRRCTGCNRAAGRRGRQQKFPLMVAQLGHLPRLALIRAPRSCRNLKQEHRPVVSYSSDRVPCVYPVYTTVDQLGICGNRGVRA